jgi:glyoxylase-like metal-dependent hydrolase (beta-lactamase superfamily II)
MIQMNDLQPKRIQIATIALLVVAILGLAGTAIATTPDVELWRLDCGSFPNFDMTALSDDDRYRGQRRNLADGCYLIRHGSDYLLWDAGLPVGSNSGAPKQSIAAQIAQVGVSPDQIHYLGLSHWHPDHIGQAADFPKAKLLIGAADWEQLKNPPKWLNTTSLSPWMTGGSAIELVSRDPVLSHDKDVFGDGSVVMFKTPGHTPGHHSLLVRLEKTGVVMLTGDLFHQHESYEHDVIPSENQDRADTLASIDRFKRLVSRYKATVVVQHDAGDIDKLPAFPASAR